MNKQLVQLEVMLGLQDDLNRKVNPNWKEANNNWYRACWIECAELMDYCNWKWWKHQKYNQYQAHLELVDIFFFTISLLIEKGFSKKDLTNICELSIEAEEFSFKLKKDVCMYVEDLAFSYLAKDNIEIILYHFFNLTAKLNLSFDKLYEMYIAKNVLNIFRQDKGYKEGTYIKQWPSPLISNSTIEDNVYLEMFLSEPETQKVLIEAPENFFDHLYNKLEDDYPG